MTTAATSLLGLALPVTGELAGTWGTTVNDSITSLLDTAVAGTTTISTDADVTLTTTTLAANQARQAIILWTANGTATRTITAPAQSKIYTVINASAGTQSIVLRGATPTTGVTILKGESAICAWNGSDFIKVSNTAGAGSFTDLTVSGSLSLTGGTANGVLYLNGSKVATSGSALTFDGTNLGLSGTGARYINLGTTSTNGQTAALQISAPNSDASASVYRVGSGLTADNEWTVYDVTSTQTVDKYIRGSSGFRAFYQNGSEQMRLTSTGLGIGTPAPGVKLEVSGAASSAAITGSITNTDASGFSVMRLRNTGASGKEYQIVVGGHTSASVDNFYVYDATAAAVRLTLDSSGNLGLGVTPSAWGTIKALQIGYAGIAGYASTGGSTLWLNSNAYFNGSSWIYQSSAAAAQYQLYSGQHQWYTAPSGTAGNAITFTQAMTLDSGGRLGIGATSPDTGSGTKLTVQGIYLDAGGSDAGYGWQIVSSSAGVAPMQFIAPTITFSTGANLGRSERMRLDTSGNLGLGVTPSAWSGFTALQITSGLSAWSSGVANARINANTYYNGGYKYIGTGTATMYEQDGYHAWYNAASGTAGNAISFTQAMTLDASGNLGLGSTTTSGGRLVISQSNGVQPAIYLPTDESTIQGSSANTQIRMGGNLVLNGANLVNINGVGASAYVSFSTNNTERARIDSSGVFSTTASGGINVRIASFTNSAGTTPAGLIVNYTGVTGGTGSTFITCADNADRFAVLGNGNCQNANNSYGAISDVKLKENIVDATPKLVDLMKVQVRNYNLKSDPEHKQIGVVAQELEQVFPGMVEEVPDFDKEGNGLGTTTKSVKYSVFVPMLIKALQEQQALIETLTARVASLESK